MKNMDQLSGGQKAVVALAFILAIQQCDPAPFYLFDEVDAALDPEFRAAIASLVGEQVETVVALFLFSPSNLTSSVQASSAQFLATTFRPELLETADKFFGVSFSGTSSVVRPVDKDTARGFVRHS